MIARGDSSEPFSRFVFSHLLPLFAVCVMVSTLTGCDSCSGGAPEHPRTGGTGQSVGSARNVFPPPPPTPTPSTRGGDAAPHASGTAPGVLFLIEPDTGRVLFAREDGSRWDQATPSGLDVRGPVTAVVQLPDGQHVLMGSLAGITRSNLVSGTGASVSDNAVAYLGCSPDGSTCFSVSPGWVGAGFRRSVDGGATFQTGGAGLLDENAYESGAAALFSPARGICLIALHDGRVFRSADSGLTFTSSPGLPLYSFPTAFASSEGAIFVSTNQGVFRSTNGGASFSAANGNLPGTNVLSVSASGASVYAALETPGNLATAGIYRSRDAGASWTLVRGSSPDARITGVLSSPSGTYATTNSGLLRSRDDGATWESFSEGLSDCDTRALLTVGGAILQGTFGARSGIFRSSDQGASWDPVNAAMDGQYVTCLAASGMTVLAGTESASSPSVGIFRSTDGGATFAAANSGIPVSGSDPVTINGLAADANTWVAVGTGGSARGFLAYRSADGGATWTSVGSSLGGSNGQGLYSAVFVPLGSSRVLLAGGSGGIFRSTDDGNSWSSLTPVAPSGNQSVSALAVSGNSVFAAVSSPYGEPGVAGVWVSSDQGKTWKPYGSTFTGLARRSVTSMAFSGSALHAGTSSGVYSTVDEGATWTSAGGAQGFVTSLAVTGESLLAGLKGGGILRMGLTKNSTRLVPIVLDVSSGTAHYTTELAITNREAKSLSLSLRYTASLGEGTGTVTTGIQAGQQLVIDDVIAYLRQKGLSIPASGAQGGTLLVTFEGVTSSSLVSVTARTASQTSPPQPDGRAGLAYSALRPWDASTTNLTVYGLRSNETDRSNLAVFSMSAEPVTLRVTAHSGARDGASQVIADELTLPAFGWRQFDRVLERVGMSTGWVTVERLSKTGSFSAYGVINDNGTNDGSYLLPVGTVLPAQYFTIPVLLESAAYRSELVLANRGKSEASFDLTYTESASPSGGTGGTVTVKLAAGEQRIIPEAIDFIRGSGARLGPQGAATYVGQLHVGVKGISLQNAYAGARSAARSSATGQFGLFTAPLLPGDEAATDAFIYGLKADDKSRSNVAVLNTGTGEASAVTLEVSAHDGDAGGTRRGDLWTVTLEPGQWAQQSNFLGSRGIKNGWVKVSRTSGTGLWAAYGVVNDGGVPQQKTDDGAFVPMTR